MTRYDPLPLLRYLLKRLVRIAIGSGITYQAFSKVLRALYFEVGEDFEPVKGKPNSDSRISLLTGLPRREVRSLREQAASPPAMEVGVERMVLDVWSSSLDLIDAQGRMLPLHRTRRLGGEQSFEALVERVSKDIRSRSLLDEWLRKGCVVLDEQDRVVLTDRSFAAGIEGPPGSGLLLGEMVSDLINGFEQAYILARPAPGFGFHVAYGHRLTEESSQLLCAAALRESAQMINRLNRLIVERETLDRPRADATKRVMFGTGAYAADEALDPGLLAPAAKPSSPLMAPGSPPA